jgi:hypothetical protein
MPIAGLTAVPSLRVLMLGKNAIGRIEGLETLVQLDVLDLHSNQVRVMENLSHLRDLRVLNLAGNAIQRIDGITGLGGLTELNLRRNHIDRLAAESFTGVTRLQRLFLSNNTIPSLDATRTALCASPLSASLVELALDGNPVAQEPAYYPAIVDACSQLRLFDLHRITDEERRAATTAVAAALSHQQQQQHQLASYTPALQSQPSHALPAQGLSGSRSWSSTPIPSASASASTSASAAGLPPLPSRSSTSSPPASPTHKQTLHEPESTSKHQRLSPTASVERLMNFASGVAGGSLQPSSSATTAVPGTSTQSNTASTSTTAPSSASAVAARRTFVATPTSFGLGNAPAPATPAWNPANLSTTVPPASASQDIPPYGAPTLASSSSASSAALTSTSSSAFQPAVPLHPLARPVATATPGGAVHLSTYGSGGPLPPGHQDRVDAIQRMEQAWHSALAQSAGQQPANHIAPSSSPTAASAAATAATATGTSTAIAGGPIGSPPGAGPSPQQQIQLSLEQRAFYDLNPARTTLSIYGPALGVLWGAPTVNNIAASVTVQPSLVANSVLSPTLTTVTSLSLAFVEHGKIMESLPLIAQMTQLRALALTHNHITALFQLEPLMVLSSSNIDTLTLSPNPVTVACPSLYAAFAVALMPRLRTVDGVSITPVLERRSQAVFGGLVAAWRTPNLSRPKQVKPAWLSLLTSEPVRKTAPPVMLTSSSSSLMYSLASSSSLPGLASSSGPLSMPSSASATALTATGSTHSNSITNLLSGSPSADALASAGSDTAISSATALHGSYSSSSVGPRGAGVGAAAAAAAAVGAVTSIVVSRSGRSSLSQPWSVPVPSPWYDTAPHHGNGHPSVVPSGLHTVLYACVYLTALSLSKRSVAQTQSRNRKTARSAVEQWLAAAWASHERQRRVAQKFPAILRKLIRATLEYNVRPESLNAVLASRLTMAQTAAAEAAREAAAAAKAAQEAKERAAAEASMGSAFGSWGMGGIGSSVLSRGGASLGVAGKP